MSSIREQAREAQSAEFADAVTDGEKDVRDRAATLYDSIDALTAEQRDLLVQSALSAVHNLMFGSHESGGYGQTLAAKSIIAIAGYANETNREDRGQTATGDRAVEDVLKQVRGMLSAQIASLGGGSTEDIDAAAERVKARVAAGEDFEVAARDEADKMGLKHNHPTPDKESPETSTGPVPDRYSGDGLYL